ncbi:hypothetical protein [Sulfurirhabdus autotrophica]|uniref:Uncharacterized protein n=1 Tax=Sulfurirhabdus autotrophica TaxID=1706046 RepID=A0A4R3YIH6_9PROT|nr:hypothetical protein [Sulfurirhabdus autotrophica]TCV90804.1 hypothetical protein EDC63_101778 [Sulfurirhabdus autotrophica]
MIINPFAAPAEPVEKRIMLKTKAGQQVSLEVTLADDKGRQSAAEYIRHLFEEIRKKMDEPVIIVGAAEQDYFNEEEIKKQILYVASFHDSMFGTFNQQSKLPEDERNEFIELFLLACATVLEGKNILIDLEKGKIGDESRLN